MINETHSWEVAEQLRKLNEMCARIARSTSEEDLFPLAAEAIHEIIGAQRATVGRREGDELVLRAINGPLGEVFVRRSKITRDCILKSVLDEGKILLVNKLAQTEEALLRPLADMGLSATIAVPLRIGDRILGAAGVSRSDGHPFTSGEAALLSSSQATLQARSNDQ